MWIRYENTNVQGQQLKRAQTKTKPVFTIPTGSFLIMYDPDAPPKRSGRAWIHWIVDSEGNEILPYIPPTPPVGTGIHRYIFRLMNNKPEVPRQRNGQPIKPLEEGEQEVFFTVNAEQKGGKRKTYKKRRGARGRQ